MRRCTSHTGSSPLWYSTSSTPNSVVPSWKRAMLAREWRSTASNARARTTQSLRGTSVGDRLMSLQEPFRGPRCSPVCSKSSISISRQFLGGIANMFANLGLLALRLTLGLVFLGHGAQKAFGSFGGAGLACATGFIGRLRLRPAAVWSALARGAELPAGRLILLDRKSVV